MDPIISISELGPLATDSAGAAEELIADPTRHVCSLEQAPVLVIEAGAGWRFIDFQELWRYRELLFFLTWRDIKLRYKQTVLGAAWAVLQPLLTMLVFTAFLGRVAAQPGASIPYPLFVFSGLLPWTLFANGLANASQSVVGSQNLVTKIYFPRLIIPMGAIAAGVVDFLVGFGLLLGMMIWYGASVGWSLWLLPVTTLLLILGVFGIGTLLAALTVAYRDFRHIVPFMVQIWLFATPSIYMQNDTLSPELRALLPYNPAYGLIGNFRQAMFGGSADWYGLVVSGGMSILLLLVGCLYFRRVERHFADTI